jgi:lipoprotein-releasing system ATP-binding protein
MLIAKSVEKKYGNLQVLKGVDIEVSKGEIVSIVGSSGAGKSTFLHILGTLDKADKGEITLNNQRVDRLKGKSLSSFRNKHIGFIFQFHHLLPEFTAIENVCIPGWIAGNKKKEVLIASFLTLFCNCFNQKILFLLNYFLAPKCLFASINCWDK